SLESSDFNAQYQAATPHKSNRFSFRPSEVAPHYLAWPRLIDFATKQPFAGIAEDRRKSLIGIDQEPLRARMKAYFDPNVTWEKLSTLAPFLTRDLPRFDAKKARTILLNKETFSEARLLPFAMRPFDVQWCYYSPVRPLWREPRPEYWSAYDTGMPTIVSRFNAAKSPEGSPLVFARQLCDYHLMPPNASVFPLQFKSKETYQEEAYGQASLLEKQQSVVANLSAAARSYLSSLGLTEPNTNAQTAGLIWMHSLAIGYSPAYLTENAEGISQDWPRIPLPKELELLKLSALLGQQVADLLETKTPVKGVTTGTIRPELAQMGIITSVSGGQLRPEQGDLEITVGWGHPGKEGVTMPGKGKLIERDYTLEEVAALEKLLVTGGLTVEQAFDRLGGRTCDLYLNEKAYWRNVPLNVWNYYIGGYQVIKKWLSYREKEMLGRALQVEEAREVTAMIRRIAALVLLEPYLDQNYRAVKAATYKWPLPNNGFS
ncbi:MAG: type ISP restriction/modification enzyme, partial [Chloroflexota bacterium]